MVSRTHLRCEFIYILFHHDCTYSQHFEKPALAGREVYCIDFMAVFVGD